MVWHSPLPEPSTTGWHRLATSHLLLMYQRGFDMFLHGERPLFREERSGKGWVYGVWMLVQAVEHFPSASIWRGLWESSERSLPMAFWHLFFGFLAVSLDLRGFEWGLITTGFTAPFSLERSPSCVSLFVGHCPDLHHHDPHRPCRDRGLHADSVL